MISADFIPTNMEHHPMQAEDESDEGPLVPPPQAWFESTNNNAHTQMSFVANDTTSSRTSRAHPNQSIGLSGVHNDQTFSESFVPPKPPSYGSNAAVGNTHPSPSWKEISSQVLPAAAKELLSTSIRRIYHTARISYARGRWQRKFSDMGNNAGGFYLPSDDIELPAGLADLPHFSSLPWVDRQLVREWRTYLPVSTGDSQEDDEDCDFDRARALVPNPLPRPVWRKTDVCHTCHKPFGPTRLRHHCRLCGYSFCQTHSSSSFSLPQLGYDPDVPERVCDVCKASLSDRILAERVAWRLARCRDYTKGNLTPYFEIGLDSMQDVAVRITKAALVMAKSIPLGAQATVAVETVDVLRKYGLHGIYGIMLRQEFLAAADLLRRALGINKTSWPLSVHELSAAIFYALAQHRAMRGLNPEREDVIHALRPQASATPQNMPGSTTLWTEPIRDTRGGNARTNPPVLADNYELSALSFHNSPVLDQTDTYNPDPCAIEEMAGQFVSNQVRADQLPQADTTADRPTFTPVCDPVSDNVLASLVIYAPIALNFIYAEKEVDMQLLAAQQGWRLLYAFLGQDLESEKPTDRPASAVFIHDELKVACLAVRGTATIHDVVTDIRQLPVPFPEDESDKSHENADEWTNIVRGQGVALSGMSAGAINLFREHIDSLVYFARQGYRIRLTGHSLGGGVATLMGVLISRHLESCAELRTKMKTGTGAVQDESSLLRVYAFGTPSCVDAKLADSVNSFVTTVVLHDDVFPRLTPTSCRGLLKHLLHIRETWVKAHMHQDLHAVGERARRVWAPRFRQDFTLRSSSKSIKKYCRRQIQRGKETLIAATTGLGNTEEKTGTETKRTDTTDNRNERDNHGKGPRFVLEFLGGAGIDNDRTEGMVIDGDEFFDTEDKLVESDGEQSDISVGTENFDDPLNSPDDTHTVSDSWSLDIHGPRESVGESCASFDKHVEDIHRDEKDTSVDGGEGVAVVLDETPLPRMFVPGRIIHMYSHRGIYKAAYVPRNFRELRRISLAANMLSNHTTKSYYEGLLEVQTARAAPENPPRWTAFDEETTCCCCASRFTWASTSDSEAQEARDKHNCRSCGGLVCDPCAKHRLPIPSIGITVPVRVCDRCYNDMGGLSTASSSMQSSLMVVEEEEEDRQVDDATASEVDVCVPAIGGAGVTNVSKPERQRERRSVVVDDLASRIRLSALTTSH